jgi:hypothetical protein
MLDRRLGVSGERIDLVDRRCDAMPERTDRRFNLVEHTLAEILRDWCRSTGH